MGSASDVFESGQSGKWAGQRWVWAAVRDVKLWSWALRRQTTVVYSLSCNYSGRPDLV